LSLSTSGKQEGALLALVICAAALIHVSIAASQIALGVAIAWLLVTQRKLSFPRVWLPLACLFVWTLIADLVCPDPWLGRAQVKKFYDFLFLPVIYATFSRHFARVQLLIAAWLAVASASGAWGLLQFAEKYSAAKRAGTNFYLAYVGQRITGFESHWMTFGALQLSVLSLALAHWFFAKKKLPVWVYGVATPILAMAIVLGWTRSIWLAAVPSVLYLIWFWRPKMMFAVPVLAVVAFFIAPAGTRDRITSLVKPHGDTDSNQHRIVTFRTGVEMIKAHPWFGIGPEQIGRQFNAYLPADVHPPLPTGYYGHLHNIYVQYAAERGIPALLCVLWLVGLAVWDAISGLRMVSGNSTQAAVLHGGIAVIVGILVGGAFEYNIGDSEVLMMFVCVLGLIYAARANMPAETFEELAQNGRRIEHATPRS
jgi:O-antigen ligase